MAPHRCHSCRPLGLVRTGEGGARAGGPTALGIEATTDLCFPSTGHRGRFVKEHALGRELRAALISAKLPTMTWYQCTRHTFASRWVQAGGSLAKLAEILGHSTTEVTLRYAHLAPGNFTEHERQLVDVQLHDAPVLPLAQRRPA